MLYDKDEYEKSVVKYLEALAINPDDSETLSNLGLALANTQYKDYANIAFEEAVNSCPGNTDILENYMLFLLET